MGTLFSIDFRLRIETFENEVRKKNTFIYLFDFKSLIWFRLCFSFFSSKDFKTMKNQKVSKQFKFRDKFKLNVYYSWFTSNQSWSFCIQKTKMCALNLVWKNQSGLFNSQASDLPCAAVEHVFCSSRPNFGCYHKTVIKNTISDI